MIYISKYKNIYNWLNNCPQLSTLWAVSAEESSGDNVLLPQGTSQRFNKSEIIDVNNNYECDLIPLPSIYEDYQINCYRDVSAENNDYNILTFDEVTSICDWIISQDEALNFPVIQGKKIISVEPYPFNPQIRGINPDTGLIAYFITLRITYVNNARRRSVEYGE